MIFIRCPTKGCEWCAELKAFPQYLVGLKVRCPRCNRQSYHDTTRKMTRTTPSEPSPSPAAPTPGEAPALLATAHQCQHCKGFLETPLGKRHGSASCPHCDRLTSVFAIRYHCLQCGRLLEAPANQQGRENTCPACRHAMQVPSDVLHGDDFDPQADTCFHFDCPSCDASVKTRISDVGQWAVCPRCLNAIEIPNFGYHLEAPCPAKRPLASRLCIYCGMRMPKESDVCLYCEELQPAPPGMDPGGPIE